MISDEIVLVKDIEPGILPHHRAKNLPRFQVVVEIKRIFPSELQTVRMEVSDYTPVPVKQGDSVRKEAWILTKFLPSDDQELKVMLRQEQIIKVEVEFYFYSDRYFSGTARNSDSIRILRQDDPAAAALIARRDKVGLKRTDLVMQQTYHRIQVIAKTEVTTTSNRVRVQQEPYQTMIVAPRHCHQTSPYQIQSFRIPMYVH
jgi:hypothetical protein